MSKDPFALESGVPDVPDIGEGLRPKPKFADRISKRVLGVAFAFVAVLVGLFLASLDQMDNKTKAPKPKEVVVTPPSTDNKGPTLPPELNGVSADFGPAKNSSQAVPATLIKPGVLDTASAALFGASPSVPASGGIGGGKRKGAGGVPAMDEDFGSAIPKDQGRVPAAIPVLTPEQQAEKLEKAARAGRLTQARSNGLQGKPFSTDDAKAGGAMSPALEQAMNALKNASAGGGGGQPAAGAKSGDGEQDEKMDFVKNASKEDRGYHPHVALPALSKNEIKTGSFIPMTLETSINSDLPGQITARVTEDVFDSITGCRVLIPAMSKVVGKYDSKVALGQGRMLVVWNSMILPNGSELNMGSMQGYDTSGQSGLESDVDNHYWRMFGLTFGMSMLTAGVQLSVPQPNPSVNGAAAPQTPSQIVAAALAQQYGTLGAQILGKYMQVQPTLRNFAGERFVVMVPHTIVFPKVWRDRCSRAHTF